MPTAISALAYLCGEAGSSIDAPNESSSTAIGSRAPFSWCFDCRPEGFREGFPEQTVCVSSPCFKLTFS
eukprot:CAMPEP_0195654016 /NCGR_PEP_ID=MMETSP0815-20121206/33699_1 /TAXON_ID=97485 /ORGANISM="Prymnesium parvum, Strain Texoma1" /LENGTH=68 /DNA_ID=CAMNT_0040798207 /DNA_START=415 /DNA_END=617 /DNA_ORIENTATION=+